MGSAFDVLNLLQKAQLQKVAEAASKEEQLIKNRATFKQSQAGISAARERTNNSFLVQNSLWQQENLKRGMNRCDQELQRVNTEKERQWREYRIKHGQAKHLDFLEQQRKIAQESKWDQQKTDENNNANTYRK